MLAGRPPPRQVVSAAPPRLEVPQNAREPCTATRLEGVTIGDLAIAYRSRGVDIRECEGKRALSVATIDEEHRLEDLHAEARADRNRAWWKKLTPWRED